jgi:hypothetical protein
MMMLFGRNNKNTRYACNDDFMKNDRQRSDEVRGSGERTELVLVVVVVVDDKMPRILALNCQRDFPTLLRIRVIAANDKSQITLQKDVSSVLKVVLV